tara:strand:- start:200 stop:1570 length:1371 start_codon:yes stop_codon:yes gene_type:complete
MSKIEVNTVAPQCGTTLTLGESGDTVTLGTGASQSGFGRTGTVDWETTPKTSTFTGVSGKGYFINSGSELTCNLPAGTAGDIISFSDYARNFATYKFSVSPNGSEKVGGVAQDAILNIDGQAATFIYVDSTKGWINVQNAEDTETGQTPAFIAATGGTITTVCTNYKVHTFTGPGTFEVTCAGNALGSNTVSYLVIAGGAGGGGEEGGGGGAGGFRESESPFCSYTQSPLATSTGLPVSATSYPIQVGGGGAGQTSGPTPAAAGTPSIFSSVTSTGGGRGGGQQCGHTVGLPGGSGGGGHGDGGGTTCWTGGTGNTPPVSPAQGKDGGNGFKRTPAPPGPASEAAGGGGGATACGVTATLNNAGNGGAGATTSINGTPTARAGGGGGGAGLPSSPIGTGGTGGGGNGTNNNTTAGAGTTNTGSGGGGGGGNGGAGPGGANGGAGGSGIVIIRYKFQ